MTHRPNSNEINLNIALSLLEAQGKAYGLKRTKNTFLFRQFQISDSESLGLMSKRNEKRSRPFLYRLLDDPFLAENQENRLKNISKKFY